MEIFQILETTAMTNVLYQYSDIQFIVFQGSLVIITQPEVPNPPESWQLLMYSL